MRVITGVSVLMGMGDGAGAACGLRRLGETFRAQFDWSASEGQGKWCDRVRGGDRLDSQRPDGILTKTLAKTVHCRVRTCKNCDPEQVERTPGRVEVYLLLMLRLQKTQLIRFIQTEPPR